MKTSKKLIIVFVVLFFLSSVTWGGVPSLGCRWPWPTLDSDKKSVGVGCASDASEHIFSLRQATDGQLKLVFLGDGCYEFDRWSSNLLVDSLTNQPEGSWCGAARTKVVWFTAYTRCSEQVEDEMVAWDPRSFSCVRCTKYPEVGGGYISDAKDIYEKEKYWAQEVDTSSWEMTKTNYFLMNLEETETGGYIRSFEEVSKPLDTNKRIISSACAVGHSGLDVRYCHGYFSFSILDNFELEDIEKYIGWGIFRPNQYRKVERNYVIKEDDEYRTVYDFGDYEPSDSIPYIAHSCLTGDEYGVGKCASYCNYLGQLVPMQCVDDRECPNTFVVSQKDYSDSVFRPIIPDYEVLMHYRYCDNQKLPFSCKTEDVVGLEENPIACAAYGGVMTYAGEPNVGSYPDMNNLRCCGNDVFGDGTPREFVKYRVVVGGEDLSDYEDVACCNDRNKCVYDRRCYTQNQRVTIEGVDAYCYNGVWIAQQVSLYFGYPSYTELPKCGDFICDLSSGENCFTCPEDCSVKKEFGSSEKFEEVIMHKGDKNYYPSYEDSVFNDFHRLSYYLTWHDEITCEAYSESKYKSAYGWGMKKSNYQLKREVPYCDPRVTSDCGVLHYYLYKNDDDGYWYVNVTANRGDTVTVSYELNGESKEEVKTFNVYFEGTVYRLIHLDVQSSNNKEDIIFDRVDYVQNPKSFTSTCMFDSECASNNCAKFGRVGVCCPFNYIFNGEECIQRTSFSSLNI